MTTPAAFVRKFARDDAAAALVEYGLLVLLIAVIAIVAMKTLGSSVSNTLNTANNLMP
jgi:Flp pilus assembly pilin Flp